MSGGRECVSGGRRVCVSGEERGGGEGMCASAQDKNTESVHSDNMTRS